MAKQNAYQVFVKEEARRREKNGQPVNIASLFKELGDQWKEMPEERKKYYKNKAENWNNNPLPPRIFNSSFNNDNEELKTNSPGNLKQELNNDFKMEIKIESNAIVPVKRSHEDSHQLVEKRIKMGHGIPNWNNIKDTSIAERRYKEIKLYEMLKCCRDFIRDRERRLLNIPIYTISVNVLCKVKKTKGFIPIEIGIYSYQIGKGRLAAPYNVMIDAGSPPTSHINLAMDHFQYHKIPFPPRHSYPACARKDYKNIYMEILEYIKKGQRTIIVPRYSDMDQVVKSLEWLHGKATEDGSNLPKVSTFTVFPMKEFMLGMYTWVAIDMLHRQHEDLFGLGYWLEHLIEIAAHDYDSAFMCNYHKIEENETRFCTQSCAIRMINDVENIIDEIHRMYLHALRTRQQAFVPTTLFAVEASEEPECHPVSDGVIALKITESNDKPLAISDRPSQ